MKLAPLLPLSLAACLAGPPTVPPAPVAAVAAPMPAISAIDVPLPWPRGGDCRSRAAAVLAVPDADRRRLDATGSPFAVATYQQVVADIPLRAEADAPCRIEIGLTVPLDAAPAHAVAHRIVRSEYRQGTSRSRNPRWAELDEAERRIDARSGGGGSYATGDPTLDMIGLFGKAMLGGVDWLGRRVAGRAVEAERAGTERSLETARWAPYTYEVTTMAADRVATVEVSLEGLSGPAVVARALLREARQLEVAKGRNRSDRGLLEDAGDVVGTAADLDLWRSQPPTLTVSRLLRALVDGEMASQPEPAPPRSGTGSGAVRSVGGSVGSDGVWRLRLPSELSPAVGPAAPDDP